MMVCPGNERSGWNGVLKSTSSHCRVDLGNKV